MTLPLRTSARRAKLGYVVVFALALVGLSCSSGDKLNPVKGKVLYKGEPLSGALVSFHPKGSKDIKVVSPTGRTKDDGTFTVTTGEKEGAQAGEYVVTIICSEVPQKESKAIVTGGIDSVDRLKGAYANVESSKITIVIKNGSNELEPFDLK